MPRSAQQPKPFRVSKPNPLMQLLSGASGAIPQFLQMQQQQQQQKSLLDFREKELSARERQWKAQLAETEEARKLREMIFGKKFELEEDVAKHSMTLADQTLAWQKEKPEMQDQLKRDFAEYEASLEAENYEKARMIDEAITNRAREIDHPFLREMAQEELREIGYRRGLAERGMRATEEQLDIAYDKLALDRRRVVVDEESLDIARDRFEVYKELGYREADARDMALSAQIAIANLNQAGKMAIMELEQAWDSFMGEGGMSKQEFAVWKMNRQTQTYVLINSILHPDNKELATAAIEMSKAIPMGPPIDLEWKKGVWTFGAKRWGRGIKIGPKEGSPDEMPPPGERAPIKLPSIFAPRIEPTGEGTFGVRAAPPKLLPFGPPPPAETPPPENIDRIYSDALSQAKEIKRLRGSAVAKEYIEDIINSYPSLSTAYKKRLREIAGE